MFCDTVLRAECELSVAELEFEFEESLFLRLRCEEGMMIAGMIWIVAQYRSW